MTETIKLNTSKVGIVGNELKPALPPGTEAPSMPGLIGESTKGAGVLGRSDEGVGVSGVGALGTGVFGTSDEQTGVTGVSKNFVGVWAETESGNQPALLAKGPKVAGRFEGDVEVTGDIRLLNADCAEDFNIDPKIATEAGMVMVMADEEMLVPGNKAYDRRVAGVISGAGHYKPGIVLDTVSNGHLRKPVALMGKVFCYVDATYGAINVGDLLTTSPSLGYAMKVEDPLRAIGAVLGKALRPLQEGKGLIPILVALQ